MGSGNSKKGIVNYWLFHKKLELYLNGSQFYKDNTKIKEGYLFNPDWISEWKKNINYDEIKINLSQAIQFKDKDSYKLNKEQMNFILENSINDFSPNFIFKAKNKEFLPLSEKIINKKYLESIVNKKTFKDLDIQEEKVSIEIKYIKKKKMLILIFTGYKIIKMLISDLSSHLMNKKVVNLTFIFNDVDNFKKYLEIFEDETSDQILNRLLDKKIFNNPKIQKSDKDNFLKYELINEELFLNQAFQSYSLTKFIHPNKINYSLINRPSYRGLDNVGATCYMNATLQCLANIRPITEQLLSQNKYMELYLNYNLCKLTLEYCQVLIGLYFNNSQIGSYKPDSFKNVLGEMNSLFQGVKANDSKDLIIFLLETFNKELVQIHNKKKNIKGDENESNPNIDPTNEHSVFNAFRVDFSRTHYSVVGFNLCGFQRNVFICNNCNNISNDFNIFNFLNFGLEATSNFFNLSNNHTQIPIITFDHCFSYLSREETLQQTYCRKCKITGGSKYKEIVYMLPNYLIIILNRGKGNTFNCRVDIPERFCSSNYEQIVKNNIYQLIGIVSHFGESGMGGHFIAFCRHSMDGKWRCYNDSIVAECQNDYLNKGTPYILFYENISTNSSKNKISQNNNCFPNIFNNQNAMNNCQQMNDISIMNNMYNISNINSINDNSNNLNNMNNMSNMNNINNMNNNSNFMNNVNSMNNINNMNNNSNFTNNMNSMNNINNMNNNSNSMNNMNNMNNINNMNFMNNNSNSMNNMNDMNYINNINNMNGMNGMNNMNSMNNNMNNMNNDINAINNDMNNMNFSNQNQNMNGNDYQQNMLMVNNNFQNMNLNNVNNQNMMGNNMGFQTNMMNMN